MPLVLTNVNLVMNEILHPKLVIKLVDEVAEVVELHLHVPIYQIMLLPIIHPNLQLTQNTLSAPILQKIDKKNVHEIQKILIG